MNNLDSRLASGLHDLVDAEPTSTPPTQQIMLRGVRARRRRTTAIVSASCAVLAVGVLTVTALAQPPAALDRPGTITEAGPATVTPRLELASAVTASESISYRLKVTANPIASPGHTLTAQERAGEITHGAFDPVTDTGYLRSPYVDSAAHYEERLIDGVRYVGSSGSPAFKQYPGKHDRLDYDRILGGALGASADPAQLLADLRDHGTVTRTGAGTYHFEIVLSEDSGISGTITGDVVVDQSSKRISRVSYEKTTSVTKKGQTSVSRGRAVLEFSDYGTDVTVERPARVVVVR